MLRRSCLGTSPLLRVISISCVILCLGKMTHGATNVGTLDMIGLETKKPITTDGGDIRIVFSDLDGTLIHYPSDLSHVNDEFGNRILDLPPSQTGMKGIISSRTLSRCRDLRQRGIKLVLVSGMRTTTFLKRLPYLPKADAYCTESGGRIFYPTEDSSEENLCKPVPYDGALPGDLVPFGLREDLKWRKVMERPEAAGTSGYAGNEASAIQDDVVPVEDREGILWDFARQLLQEGLVLDTEGYSTCFRVNRKHQSEQGKEKFDALERGDLAHPPQLWTSMNLGCIDYYPIASGKKNCCQFLANELLHFGADMLSNAVCLCDDDNDIEMALACSHAYIPALSSRSMQETIRSNPAKFTPTFRPSVVSTAATEAALQLIFDRIATAQD